MLHESGPDSSKDEHHTGGGHDQAQTVKTSHDILQIFDIVDIGCTKPSRVDEEILLIINEGWADLVCTSTYIQMCEYLCTKALPATE